MFKFKPRIAFFGLALSALMPLPAAAHLSDVQMGDFWLGVLHPLLTLEDLACFLMVGFLAGQLGMDKGLKIICAFSLMLGVGAVLAIQGVMGPWVSWADLASMMVFGGLVALAYALPLALVIGLAVLAGIAHGINNGVEVVAPVKAVPFIFGLILGGLFSTFYAMLLVLKLKPWWTRIAIRVVGSWTAAIGLLVLGLGFSR